MTDQPSTKPADPVLEEAQRRIKEIHISPRFVSKKQLRQRTRRLPPPGPGTRYFMARTLDGIPAREEVTHDAVEWHKAGTLMRLLQGLYVVAVPQVDLTRAGEPPAVAPAHKLPPTVDEIVAGLVAETGAPRAAVVSLALRIAALERGAYVRRLPPYGDRQDDPLAARSAPVRAKLQREVEELLARHKPAAKEGEAPEPQPGAAVKEPGSDLPPAEYVTAEAQPGTSAPVTETLVEPAAVSPAPADEPAPAKRGKRSKG